MRQANFPGLNPWALEKQAPEGKGARFRFFIMPAQAGICSLKARGFSPVARAAEAAS